MEKLRIQNKDIYRIEVNNKGEYIEFDLSDIGLKVKCYEALDKIEKIANDYKSKFNNQLTEKEIAYIEQDMFKEMRKAMDSFLGENACQKIFGDKNYYEMFDDLIRELKRKRPELKGKSHLDMLNFSAEQVNERIIKKYNKKVKNVI